MLGSGLPSVHAAFVQCNAELLRSLQGKSWMGRKCDATSSLLFYSFWNRNRKSWYADGAVEIAYNADITAEFTCTSTRTKI